MEITQVRIKLMKDNNEHLQAFCSVTFDNMFVVRDLKIIKGTKGLFVAMPSRKFMDRCPKCATKNHLLSLFCNYCGEHLKNKRVRCDENGKLKLYGDIAHPINFNCREMIQNAVLNAYEKEKELSKRSDYVCRYDDYEVNKAFVQ